ncbi:hypothetical protein TcasGA2_TC032634 [Tribolium castaneum]|uniref:Uncharacterized protein n=1 Tax=Tribolium castaneum TaxID=7070 RepID=A0A139WJY5_TRICA|nr:hypothetical protein TcasGA2_TC032634 [Tribolium castaneum]
MYNYISDILSWICGLININKWWVCDFTFPKKLSEVIIPTRKILEGVVHKKTKDHVGCLVHKIFNVSLPKPKKHEWLGENLNPGSRIQLEITSTNFEGKLPYIKGRIINVLDATPNVLNESNNKIVFEENLDETVTKSSKKKAKKIIFDESFNDESLNFDTLIKEEPEISLKKSKKKTKRKAEVDEDIEPPIKKKKKKHVQEDSS